MTRCKDVDVAQVHATAGSEAGLQLCLASGAEEAFNHREKGYIERMREKSDGGYDVIIEMLANVNLDNDLTMLRRNGRVAVVGNRGTVTIDPRKTMAVDGAILGVAFGLCSEEELDEINHFILAGLRCGAFQPVLGKEFALGDASAAHDYIMSAGTRAAGKVWLNCDVE